MHTELLQSILKELKAAKKDVTPLSKRKPVSTGARHFFPWFTLIRNLRAQGFNKTQIVNIFMRVKGEDSPCSIRKPWGNPKSTQYNRLTRGTAMVYICHFCQEFDI